MIDYKELAKETLEILNDVLDKSNIKAGQVFVLGLSSSEVKGGLIGKESSLEIGEVIVKTLLDELSTRGIYLAVQGCEHLNRALVVEESLAEAKDYEIVNVLPTLHAGGSGQLAAFKYMSSPVEVEEIVAHAGLDIGDTSIGMHVKKVQVPIVPIRRELGGAHVTALASRPKLIGGARAIYKTDAIRKN
ncbi:TIGR01440 family protein [Streptococcus porcinus]|uniref:TIGR01440 family protein n=1 Tax=Streptococcus porcinus TaxID=1340 RepID=UPI003C7918C3